jgi:hypothetical protein
LDYEKIGEGTEDGRMKMLTTVMLCAAIFLAVTFTCAAEGADGEDDPSTAGIEGTWIWRSAEGDDFFETYIYAFGEDGTLTRDLFLPGRVEKRDVFSYKIEGKKISLTPRGGTAKGAAYPFAVFNGQLQLTMDGNTYVFDPYYEDGPIPQTTPFPQIPAMPVNPYPMPQASPSDGQWTATVDGVQTFAMFTGNQYMIYSNNGKYEFGTVTKDNGSMAFQPFNGTRYKSAYQVSPDGQTLTIIGSDGQAITYRKTF